MFFIPRLFLLPCNVCLAANGYCPFTYAIRIRVRSENGR